MSSPARTAIAFSNIGHSYTHLFLLLYPTVVLTLEKEFHRTYGELLSLATAGFVLLGLGSVPAGWLGDRWSSRGMLAVFFFGIGAAAVLTGLANNLIMIAAGLALIGLFASIYHPVGISLIVSSSSNPGRSLGYNGVIGNAGTAVAALVAGALTDWISWRAAFIVPGVVAMATGAAFLLLVRGGQSPKEGATEQARRADPPKSVIVQAIIVLSITTLCAGLIYQITSVSMPKIVAEHVSDISITGALGIGGLVSAVYLSASFANIAGGYMADRFPLMPVFVLAYAVQVPLFIVAATAGGYPLLIVMIALVSFNVGAAPVETSLIARYAPAGWRATAFGMKFTVALGVSALGVPLVALVYDGTGGFYWLFITMAALAALLVTAALFLPSPGRQPSATAEGPEPVAAAPQGD